ncbi:hypothetical protein [Gloeothece verrucosa]|uniref:Uncharacterized protein n=1 Tax=Gloeothece verrucosa (strain PCC 7822) TaxID=497965 RepID=E0UG37_GLOV7|nr:hypothetical protein [Gloeothece verrucosa]ADN15538.1 hypothetical protein Cyan7822_3597 [Gloeothece verrucosa PCC 7822]
MIIFWGRDCLRCGTRSALPHFLELVNPLESREVGSCAKGELTTND